MKPNHGELISDLFQLHVDLHFLHLVTRSFAKHKALGETYSILGSFKDSVAEKLIGYYGRDFKLKVTPPVSTIATICDTLYSFAEKLAKDPHTEFKNISDEIKAASADLRYQFTLTD